MHKFNNPFPWVISGYVLMVLLLETVMIGKCVQPLLPPDGSFGYYLDLIKLFPVRRNKNMAKKRLSLLKIWTNAEHHIWVHETWPLAKVPEVAHSPFLPQGGEIDFRSMCSSLRDTGQFSKLPYLGTKLGHWSKFQKLNIYFFSVPWGRN